MIKKPTIKTKRSLQTRGITVSYAKMTDSVWVATEATELVRVAGLDAVFPDVLKACPKATRKDDAIIIPVQLTKTESRDYVVKHRNDYENWLDGAIKRDREMLLNPPEELEVK